MRRSHHERIANRLHLEARQVAQQSRPSLPLDRWKIVLVAHSVPLFEDERGALCWQRYLKVLSLD